MQARVTKFLVAFGLGGISVAGLASADPITEYGSSSAWDAAVSNVSTYQITQIAGQAGYGTYTQEIGAPVTFGPGTFTGAKQAAIYNDGLYGAGVAYFSDAPQSVSDHHDYGSVTVAFNAADDITALAFDLGVGGTSSGIAVSVNGFAIAPASVGFFGVTDSNSPITSITFTEQEMPGQETDVIGSYQTATAAPEISPTSAPAALTLLLGLLAVFRGRRRPVRHTA